MVMKSSSALTLAHQSWSSHRRQRAHVKKLDLWLNGHQQMIVESAGEKLPMSGAPYSPREQNDEHRDLVSKAPTPTAGLIVTTLAQTAYLDGIRMANAPANADGSYPNLESWAVWQENGWDAKQIPLHRAAIGHGFAYASALPGRSRFGGGKTAVLKGYSGKRMSAFYDEDDDEFPLHAIVADPVKTDAGFGQTEDGWLVRLLDESAIHYMSVRGDGFDIKDWSYISYDEHSLGFTPIVRYTNRIDLDGRATGEIEPYIPMLRRLDQDVYDRLIVQRFGAWKIRFIAGMAKPDNMTEARAQALRLKIEDLLISPDPNTKFGTMDATEVAGYIAAHDADMRMLAAISQTPPHHLLGLSSNLQAEALAAAESGLQRKSGDFKMNTGESHESLLRVAAYIKGNKAEAQAFDTQARWRDTESRSLSQAADALSKLADGLGIPSEMLWERVPGWTDLDTERAKKLIESGAVDAMLEAFIGQGDLGSNTLEPAGAPAGN